MTGKHYIIAALSLLTAKFPFGEVTSVNYGLTNGNITLKADATGAIEEILWKWNGNKVLEVDKNSREEYGEFKGRTYFNPTTGDLTISRLTESDSGIYASEANVLGMLQYSEHHVEIIDAVAVPTVTCQMSDGAWTLICASDLSPLTTYSWEGPEGPVLLSVSELHLEGPQNEDLVYTCIVRNPVSERRGNVALHQCRTAQGSIVINLAIALGVLLVVLGVLVGIWVYCKKYKGGLDGLSQRLAQIHKEKKETETETPTENDPFIVKQKAEQDHEKNNFEEKKLRDQEDTSVLPLVSPPGHGGVSKEQGGETNEQGVVSIEQGVLNNIDRAALEEPASGTGNEEDPSCTRLVSTNIAGAKAEENVKEVVAKCQEGNLPKPLSETLGNISTFDDDGKPFPGPQDEGEETRGVQCAQKVESKGQSDATSGGKADDMENSLKGDANGSNAQNE